MRLEIGPVNGGNVPFLQTIKMIHDLEEVPASKPHPRGTRYLFVYAKVKYPHIPGMHDIFTILMRYQRPEGDEDANWPAHLAADDAEIVCQRFQAFVDRNRT